MAEGQWRQTVQAENFQPKDSDMYAAARYALTHDNTPLVESAKTDTEPFDLTQISYESLRRLAVIFKEGASKYGRNNWRCGVGDKAYQLERANHAIKHLLLYVHCLQFGEKLGVEGEDDLAKVMWFCSTQAELERLEALSRGTT